jgi:UDP-N-acetylglucosamine/UDP-N-acetylgalactosamine diphosphorylase
MTSHATDQATRDFFARENFFGLDPSSIHFLRQGVMPVVDRETGRILMSGPGSLIMNPNGHGGLLEALQSSGSFDHFAQRGIDLLYYHQVDNPLTHVGDPVMLGLHHQHHAQVTVKVVAKQTPDEKMGVLAEVDGQTQIIEYSDLTAEDVRRTTPEGDLLFWAGNTAIHVFDRHTLQGIASASNSLPYHRAIKKVGHLDSSGRWITPAVENAIKYERFIFDVLPRIQNCLVMEVERDEEFCPLKNSTGQFSPEHVREAMVSRALRWLHTRCEIPNTLTPVEISPLFALEANDLHHWKPPTSWPSGPFFLR